MKALSDRKLLAATSAALFVLAAWPLLLVATPPFQDLPNHLASSYIARHLDAYPAYVNNGLLKSNSLFELWLQLFDDGSLPLAARTFTALVLLLGSIAIPTFLLHFVGRKRMAIGALFAWPLVHNFFVSMGMMNFSFGFPFSLLLMVLLDQQRARPSVARWLLIVALSGVAWYAHPFPLIVVGALVLYQAVAEPTWARRVRVALTTLSALAPVGLLVVSTALAHFMKAEGAPRGASHGFAFLTIWELPAHYWLDAQGALTRYGALSVVPAIGLLVCAIKYRRVKRAFIPKAAMWGLVVAYLGLPLMISNWWYLNTRLAPFVWIAFALRVPPRLPPRITGLLAGCAVLCSIALGVDYRRLDRDQAELSAGIDAVPAGATLMPLLFSHRATSDFTASLTHAWGPYVLAKHTSAPLVFAVERSYELTYREFPPAALVPPALDRFAELHGTPAQVCETGVAADLDGCTELWRAQWASFWRLAEPRFTHVLTWAMPDEARGLMPPSYHRTFAAGRLEIYARGAAAP